jgi:hypothetical protein
LEMQRFVSIILVARASACRAGMPEGPTWRRGAEREVQA